MKISKLIYKIFAGCYYIFSAIKSVLNKEKQTWVDFHTAHYVSHSTLCFTQHIMFQNHVLLFKTFFFAYFLLSLFPHIFLVPFTFFPSSYSFFLPLGPLPYTYFPSFLAFQKTGLVPIMANNTSPVLNLQQYFTRRFEQVS